MGKEIFLEAAIALGQKISDLAIWDGDACTWEIVVPDPTEITGTRSVRTLATGTLYQGTAGIGTFFSELFSLTGNPIFGKCAEGAFRYALQRTESLAHNAFGFHGGRTGVAYAMARHGMLHSKQEFTDFAHRLLSPLFGSETEDRGADVIAGAAGAIPALLLLSRWTETPAAAISAIRLGMRLIKTAKRNPCGWSWSTGVKGPSRDLTGYAHGASGFAHAFLELQLSIERWTKVQSAFDL